MPEKAIFLDRDDTLIPDPGYINNPDQVKLLEGVPECLNGFRKLGYKLIVITNQSAVARGIVTEEVLTRIHERLKELLNAKGAWLDRIYYCPYHPDGVIEKYRKNSDNRKPKPGMLLTAARDLDIDLKRSWCIGNSPSDVEAGAKAGCKTILVNQMSPVDGFRQDQVKPDHIAVNIRETLNIVRKYSHDVERATPVQVTNQDNTSEAVTQPAQAPVPEPKASKKKPEEKPEEKLKAKPAPKDMGSVPPEPNPAPSQPDMTSTTTEALLKEISSQLKSMQRDDMFDEFSLVRLLAGITQTAVPFCLLIALWFLLTIPRQYEPVFTALGFAIVLQVMSLTLNMHGRS